MGVPGSATAAWDKAKAGSVPTASSPATATAVARLPNLCLFGGFAGDLAGSFTCCNDIQTRFQALTIVYDWISNQTIITNHPQK